VSSAAAVLITVEAPDSGDARLIVRQYLADVIGRYYGRPATDAEVAEELLSDAGEDLTPPTGLLLVARLDGEPVGCAGFRIVGDGIAELTKVFSSPAARGRGLGGQLLRHAEDAAVTAGITYLRLDTRTDLVEARRLYARNGYAEVEPFNAEPYAQHWFGKELTGSRS
jgi:GNAT superfamily N-acetyltransferase